MCAKFPPQSSLGSGGDRGVGAVLHPEDVGPDLGQPGEQVHRVFVGGVPVVVLAQALVVALHVDRVPLHAQDRGREHGHRVAVPRHRPQHVEDVVGHGGPGLELADHLLGVGLGRDVAGQQQVEEALHVGHVAAGHLRQLLERLGDREPAEADPLLGVQVGDVGDQALHAPRAADGHADGHIAQLDVSGLLEEGRGPRAPGFDLLLQLLLELRHALLLGRMTQSPQKASPLPRHGVQRQERAERGPSSEA